MDNTPFYNQLLKSLDYMFSTNYPAPKINKYNFAVNNRIYDPSNKGSLYPPSAYMNPQSTQGPINGDTAMGQPYIH